jgi:hypothetical protein
VLTIEKDVHVKGQVATGGKKFTLGGIGQMISDVLLANMLGISNIV